MQQDREQRIFFAVLWAYLLGSLLFFLFRISLGRMQLAAPLWFMFLVLDAGFIVFLFVPRTGKGIRGTPGRHEESAAERSWYPQRLAEIIEGGVKPREPGPRDVHPPARAIPPIPFVPLVMLLGLILLAAPGRPGEETWQVQETRRLRTTYGRAQRELGRFEELLRGIAGKVGSEVEWSRLGALDGPGRAALIRRIDSLAHASGPSWAPFREVGIQVFDRRGARIAWGGFPRCLETASREAEGVRIFTSRTALYTLLVADADIPGEGRVVVDMPLEVNYRINNRFLRSASLGEKLSDRWGVSVDFNFSMGEHRGSLGWRDASLSGSTVRVSSSPEAGVQASGIVAASTGLPLARLRVMGEPYGKVMRDAERRRIFWGGLAVAVIASVLAIWAYRVYGKRPRPEGRRGRLLLRRLGLLVLFVGVIRWLLLTVELPAEFMARGIFDPAIFADTLPGGFMRTTGDFLLSAVFLLILVFGSIKIYRTYFPGELERPLGMGGPFRLRRAALRGAVVAIALAGSVWVVSALVSRVVLNAHPRLVGLDVDFFAAPAITLHLALLFAVSAFLIAALFVMRIALFSAGGNLAEGLAGAIAGAAAALLLLARLPIGGHGAHWSAAAAGLGLLVFSFRIFPLLRKDEIISVVLASFCLVLLSSLAVYGTASVRYTELRKSRVLEKAQMFNHPEDTWVGIVLPDLCEDMASDRAIASRVMARAESAAFEIWAATASSLNLSCAFDVYDAAGARFSRFAVGMPFEISRPARAAPPKDYRPAVYSFREETKGGMASFYRGVAPIVDARGALVGWIEIVVPYFFENPELLARTSPLAPELLHNIEGGVLAPRIDEPEDLLVARVSGGRVVSSSNGALRGGDVVPAEREGWFALDVGRDRYGCVVREGGGGGGYLVGYRVTKPLEHLIQWGTIVSVDVILAMLALAALMALRRLPVLSGVMPAIAAAGGIGFRQKVMLSFLAVAMLPLVLLGVFSRGVVEARYRADGEQAALQGVQAAVSLIDHSIRTEAALFAASPALQRSGALMVRPSEGGAAAGVSVIAEGQRLYAGILMPVPGSPGFSFYYRKPLDDDFLSAVAEALGEDINVYHGGVLRASSERELFVGGFLNPLLGAAPFAESALGMGSAVVLREALGDYSYNVASAPLPALGGGENAVISVPMLYQPLLLQGEVRRTTALILGLLALLFAAAVLFGVFLSGKIFNPIAALRGGTRRIIAGELEFKLEAEAPDEIGELVQSFNAMTAALREARRDLLERQRYLAAVLDNVATGVLATDRTGAVIMLNPAGERILALERAACIGRKAGEIATGGRAALGELFSEGGEDLREAEVTLFSGESARTIKAVVASLVEGGERLGAVVVFDDLTELIKSKKLAAWIEMARQIAHEVKNPLTPIKLSAQLMRRAYEAGSGDFDGIFRGGVDTIIQQTEILRRIASEFSSFGRVTSLHCERIEITPFLAEFVAYYRGAERVAIRETIEDGIAVIADREAVRKILVNFMENALEAMPGGGAVIVRARRADGRAELSVIDEGTGLPADVQGRLFEPYFSTKTNGIGLGLAISQGLARGMDGDLRLRNREDGRGVEATVVLPLADR